MDTGTCEMEETTGKVWEMGPVHLIDGEADAQEGEGLPMTTTLRWGEDLSLGGEERWGAESIPSSPPPY